MPRAALVTWGGAGSGHQLCVPWGVAGAAGSACRPRVRAAPLYSASLVLAPSHPHPHALLSLQPELPFSGAAGWGSCLLKGSARQFYGASSVFSPHLEREKRRALARSSIHTHTHSAVMGESLLAGLGMAGTTSAFGPQPECRDVRMDWQEVLWYLCCPGMSSGPHRPRGCSSVASLPWALQGVVSQLCHSSSQLAGPACLFNTAQALLYQKEFGLVKTFSFSHGPCLNCGASIILQGHCTRSMCLILVPLGIFLPCFL